MKNVWGKKIVVGNYGELFSITIKYCLKNKLLTSKTGNLDTLGSNRRLAHAVLSCRGPKSHACFAVAIDVAFHFVRSFVAPESPLSRNSRPRNSERPTAPPNAGNATVGGRAPPPPSSTRRPIVVYRSLSRPLFSCQPLPRECGREKINEQKELVRLAQDLKFLE